MKHKDITNCSIFERKIRLKTSELEAIAREIQAHPRTTKDWQRKFDNLLLGIDGMVSASKCTNAPTKSHVKMIVNDWFTDVSVTPTQKWKEEASELADILKGWFNK